MVVLGFRNPGRQANLINRWRVDIALRELEGCDPTRSRLVLSGGASSPGTGSEASKLATYARRRGFAGDLVLEEASLITRQNVTNVQPLVEAFDRICFASQPSHALMARVHLVRQRPDLAGHLVSAPAPGLCEHPLVSAVFTLYGQVALQTIPLDELHPRTARDT